MIKMITNNNDIFPYIYNGSWESINGITGYDILGLIGICLAVIGGTSLIVGLILNEKAAIKTGAIIAGISLIFNIAVLAGVPKFKTVFTNWVEDRYGVELTKAEASTLLDHGNVTLKDGRIVNLTAVADNKGQIITTVDGKEISKLTIMSGSAVEQLKELKTLLDNGTITQSEYDTLKSKIINN